MARDDKLLLATSRIPEGAYADALHALIDAALAAGNRARAMRESGLRTWTKSGNSPVSDADLAADSILRQRLLDFAPDYEWLSEESADIAGRPTHRRRWVVDPIDGTRAFIKGQADWSISAAMVEGTRPVAAVLYAPESDELFTAMAGSGAARNGVPIAVSSGRPLAEARVAGPRFVLERLSEAGHFFDEVPRIHSLALRFARVASGEIDLALASENSRDWDLAAADLIVHEAGGTLTDARGEPVVYSGPDVRHPPLAGAGRSLHAAALSAFGKILARPGG